MTPLRYWPQKRPPIQAAPVAGPWLRLWTPTLSLLLLLILEFVSWAFQLISWVHPCPSINPLMPLVTGVCFSYLYLRTPTDSTNPLLTNLNHNAATCWINCFMSVPQARPCPPGSRSCIVLWGDTVSVPQPPFTERLVSSDAGSAVEWWAPAVSPFSCQPHQRQPFAQDYIPIFASGNNL